MASCVISSDRTGNLIMDAPRIARLPVWASFKAVFQRFGGRFNKFIVFRKQCRLRNKRARIKLGQTLISGCGFCGLRSGHCAFGFCRLASNKSKATCFVSAKLASSSKSFAGGFVRRGVQQNLMSAFLLVVQRHFDFGRPPPVDDGVFIVRTRFEFIVQIRRERRLVVSWCRCQRTCDYARCKQH